MSQRRSMVLGVALAALLAACGGGDGAAEEATTAAAAEEATTATAEEASSPAEEEAGETAAASGAAVVAVASADAGEILVDGEGRSLYRFLNDTEQGASTCVDACLDNWPILEGEAQAGEGADGAALGTLTRNDGATQVTYDGWPLYYFAGDSAAGDTNGQGVGDVWYLVAPDGSTVDAT